MFKPKPNHIYIRNIMKTHPLITFFYFIPFYSLQKKQGKGVEKQSSHAVLDVNRPQSY